MTPNNLTELEAEGYKPYTVQLGHGHRNSCTEETVWLDPHKSIIIVYNNARIPFDDPQDYLEMEQERWFKKFGIRAKIVENGDGKLSLWIKEVKNG